MEDMMVATAPEDPEAAKVQLIRRFICKFVFLIWTNNKFVNSKKL